MDSDYEYLYSDILKVLGDKWLTTLEIARLMHMGMFEVYDHLFEMEKNGRVARRWRNEDQHIVWRKL